MEEPKITQAERRRKVIRGRLDNLMHAYPDLYYKSTSEVARSIYEDLSQDQSLNSEDSEAIAPLTVRDIEVILAFR